MSLPTEGLEVNAMILVGALTNDDIMYIVQSNQHRRVTVGQLVAQVFNNVITTPSVTEPPVDGIVCIKDGAISQITPEVLVGIYKPLVVDFTIDATNLSFDCSTLDKGVVELNIDIDVTNLPATVSYGTVFNVGSSNLKKIYIKKIASRTFNTPLYYLPKVGRHTNLPSIRISMGADSTTIDNKTTFAFYGFQESSVLSTLPLTYGDIEMPYDYCDYLEILNGKAKKYYSIQGLVTLCNIWGDIDITVPPKQALPCASWIFLFGKSKMNGDQGTRFISSNNVDFQFRSVNITSSPDINLLDHALKCATWSELGSDLGILSNLIIESYTVSTTRAITGTVAGVNSNTAESTLPFAPSIKAGADSDGWRMVFNENMTFYNSGFDASGWTLVPIGWILANIAYFDNL